LLGEIVLLFDHCQTSQVYATSRSRKDKNDFSWSEEVRSFDLAKLFLFKYLIGYNFYIPSTTLILKPFKLM